MKLKTCVICGAEYQPGSNRQKYCQNCRVKVNKTQTRLRVQKHRTQNRTHYNNLCRIRMYYFRKRWKHLKQARYDAIGRAYKEHGNIMNQYHTGKGTNNFGPHRNKDFEKERILVIKELKRRGLKR